MTTASTPNPEKSLDKTFDPASIEERWYRHWEESGAFWPERPTAEPYTIVLPPPNVTGTLHIGHALDQTLQDILIRWQRLKGKDARWVVGTDHAGIATQMVVERRLTAAGESRKDMGREAFIRRVWEWKEQSGGAITGQMRRLGASCDWRHERFTMDEGLSHAVIHTFVTLYERGLIYRDKRLVNWDPKFQSAISDLEVENRELPGHFWHLRYPLADGSGEVVVATTRPETMLGDTAVAVHPDDARYQKFIGKMVAHPLTGRQIPVIADIWADPELGSGCVKITPAHDFNDWAVYERHREIGWINILDAEARIVDAESVPAAYRGLDRFLAREKIVADLEALGLVDRIEEKKIQVPHGDRSGVVIEPWITDQWYVDAGKLAPKAREAVASGRTSFIPKNWEKTYFNWLDNIEPWCISRQLWWGHQIPAWFGPAKEEGGKAAIFVAESADEALAKARAFYGREDVSLEEGAGIALHRDSDVLDTWFSSGLWPFATEGWPGKTTALARHYPTDVLVTAFDIIFFWVARMMMQGMELMEEVPFRQVYIHGLVRDANGQKMSKSKGNTVNPLDLIDRYGADALRFTLAASESQGRDARFNEDRVKGYRNFATKLWNAVRFALAQGIEAPGIEASTSAGAPNATRAVNQWILKETAALAKEVEEALTSFRFDLYTQALYHFVWNRFCDWYVELMKVELKGEGAAETRQVAGFVIDRILVLLHPVMPFITEELWHAMGHQEDLILASWPETGAPGDRRAADGCEESAREIDWLIALVSAIRSARTELNVPPSAKIALHLVEENPDILLRLKHHGSALEQLARVPAIHVGRPAGGIAQLMVEGETFALPLDGIIDLTLERQRLEKAALAAEKEGATLAKRLTNPKFVERANPEAVDKARHDHAERMAESSRLRQALASLGG